jgi:hypothetical protein
MEKEPNLETHLLVAAKVTREFKARGINLIVVGGSAIEFYTEEAYLYNDIDLCKKTDLEKIDPKTEKEVFQKLGATSTGTRRAWILDGVFVDLLGTIEHNQIPKYREIKTPEGNVTIFPAEEALVERCYLAFLNQPPRENELLVAKKMILSAILMRHEFDWNKSETLAASNHYGIKKEFDQLKANCIYTLHQNKSLKNEK